MLAILIFLFSAGIFFLIEKKQKIPLFATKFGTLILDLTRILVLITYIYLDFTGDLYISRGDFLFLREFLSLQLKFSICLRNSHFVPEIAVESSIAPVICSIKPLF